jgi:hypothetical protein
LKQPRGGAQQLAAHFAARLAARLAHLFLSYWIPSSPNFLGSPRDPI